MRDFGTIIIGGGPAGTGPVFKAIKDGSIWKLLDKGLALVESSNSLLKGALVNYKINSDTSSETFLECLEGLASNLLNHPGLDKEISFVKGFKGRSIPLNLLNDYYGILGNIISRIIGEHKKCKVFLSSSAQRIAIKPDGTFDVYIEGAENAVLSSKHVLLTTGGKPRYVENLDKYLNFSLNLSDYKSTKVHSDLILKNAYQFNWNDQAKRSVVILGGSHSAFSVAKYLLEKFPRKFSQNAIKIYCSEKPKLFFVEKKDAITAGYLDFTEEDFCPITKRLYRLAGLRMDGRELYMDILGLLDRKREDRVKVELFSDTNTNIDEALSVSDIIILATGYQMNQIPIVDNMNKMIALSGSTTGRWVNSECKILNSEMEPINNLFCMGLSTGYIPSGKLGGESTFTGQTNGIWYYQNALGDIILKQILT